MTAPLSGIKVADLTHGAFAYTAFLLARHGAEIVGVGADRRRDRTRWDTLGPPPDARLRDLEHFGVRTEIASLLASSDVVLESFPPGRLHDHGLDWQDVEIDCPRLVWASMTPFGRTGPRRDWKSSNLLAWAMSGILPSIGDSDRAPLAPGGPVPLAELLAAAHAASAVMLALRTRRQSGRGQLVEVSTQATVVAASCELGVNVFLDDLEPRRRIGNRRRQLAPSGLYACSDGYAAVIILPVPHWDALARWVHEKTGNEAILDATFRDLGTRRETAELLESWVEELTALYTKQELFEEGQRRGISITPVNALTDLLTDPQLVARGWWSEESDAELGKVKVAGPPYRFR